MYTIWHIDYMGIVSHTRDILTLGCLAREELVNRTQYIINFSQPCDIAATTGLLSVSYYMGRHGYEARYVLNKLLDIVD